MVVSPPLTIPGWLSTLSYPTLPYHCYVSYPTTTSLPVISTHQCYSISHSPLSILTPSKFTKTSFSHTKQHTFHVSPHKSITSFQCHYLLIMVDLSIKPLQGYPPWYPSMISELFPLPHSWFNHPLTFILLFTQPT